MANVAEFVTEKGAASCSSRATPSTPSAYRGTPLETAPADRAGFEARNPDRRSGNNDQRPSGPNLTVEGRSSPIFRFGDDEVTSARIWASPPRAALVPRGPPQEEAARPRPRRAPDAGRAPTAPCRSCSTSSSASGKTMFNAVDDTWRWRFGASATSYFGRFWVQTIRFLARSKLIGQPPGGRSRPNAGKYQRNGPGHRSASGSPTPRSPRRRARSTSRSSARAGPAPASSSSQAVAELAPNVFEAVLPAGRPRATTPSASCRRRSSKGGPPLVEHSGSTPRPASSSASR